MDYEDPIEMEMLRDKERWDTEAQLEKDAEAERILNEDPSNDPDVIRDRVCP